MVLKSIRRAAAKRLRANTTPHERKSFCSPSFETRALIAPFAVSLSLGLVERGGPSGKA
jgi:hypothetical protein